ncbi:AraC family transcriptional regulator [Bosea sp. TND4EK4]|uniref:AraC family transcriptional regulator n=1 Tax=Bosea sp. TND4EK4 TaxID=1907408 RepID=UPI000954FF15|nr:AraC family transcriptional regulator [Bosea sp. TND4EK4]SIQ26660.1 transcriptional regulator, AraC family [Bosea sp. TND4EK4]
MQSITQEEALLETPLRAGESAHLFAARRFGGLEFLAATFRTHAYAPHAHDTYAIGTIEMGCEIWHARGQTLHAGPGDIVMNHPLDVHDGAPSEGGYRYRMSYPTVELMSEIAASLSGRPATGTPFFREPVVQDAEGAALFGAAHRLLEEGADALAGEEALIRAYAHMLARHADLTRREVGREEGPVARVKRLIEARHDEDLSLADLAQLAGLPRHHLIRAFRRETGLTPHAYLVDVRVRRARERLRRGEMPGEVAAATGFCDQPHLTRAFKARLGVTPGAFRAAHAG